MQDWFYVWAQPIRDIISLQSNAVSHWLGANLESALRIAVAEETVVETLKSQKKAHNSPPGMSYGSFIVE